MLNQAIRRVGFLLAAFGLLAVVAIGHLALADQTDPSNCSPTPRLAGNCWSSYLVPCRNGTCVN
jgi:hypothetical protein